jgi:outer membrane protein OmpA-like peptidoglycan-associated protein
LAYFLCLNNLCEQAPSTIETEAAVIEPASETVDDCVAALLFKDNDFKVVSKDNFKFNYSNFNHNLISPEFEELLIKVAQYLGNNPNRKMKIKGLFLKEEENNTDYENLGLARAYAVKTYFLKQGVNTSQLLTSAKLANPECYNEGTLEKGIVVAFGE